VDEIKIICLIGFVGVMGFICLIRFVGPIGSDPLPTDVTNRTNLTNQQLTGFHLRAFRNLRSILPQATHHCVSRIAIEASG